MTNSWDIKVQPQNNSPLCSGGSVLIYEGSSSPQYTEKTQKGAAGFINWFWLSCKLNSCQSLTLTWHLYFWEKRESSENERRLEKRWHINILDTDRHRQNNKTNVIKQYNEWAKMTEWHRMMESNVYTMIEWTVQWMLEWTLDENDIQNQYQYTEQMTEQQTEL